MLTARCATLCPTAGVQFATNQISEGVGAAEAAAEAGADFVDLNVGCAAGGAAEEGGRIRVAACMQWHSAAACNQLCYAAGWSAQELVHANSPLLF